MKCPSCGKEIAEGSKFCVYCGVQIKKSRKPLFITLFIVIVLLALGGFGYYQYAQQKQQENNNKMLNDKESYLVLVKSGDALLADKKYSESISKYNDALVYEQKYSGTGYASHFNSNVETKVSSAKQQQENNNKMLNDKESYLVLVKSGDALLADKKYSESISKYNDALVYEQKYSGTGYASHFNSNVKAKISSAKQQQEEYAQQKQQENNNKMLNDKESYLVLVKSGDALLADKKYSESISKYNDALVYEQKYSGTGYASHFNSNVETKVSSAKQQQENNNKMLNDKESYLVLVKAGDALLADMKYSESISKYNEALVYEQKYSGTGYASHFNSNVKAKISMAKQQQEENDKESYLVLVKAGDALLADKKYSESISKYNEALVYEQKYSGTGYASHFNSNVKAKISSAKQQQEKYARTHGNIKGHEYVDLGLSVKWATCNVGASKPEDYGDYYAWGETSTKSTYSESNSKTYGKKIKDIKGNSQYDAARANWGGDWRMPTRTEMQELIDNCEWEWTAQNGVNGYKVTGPNGNSIFLPAAGYRNGSSLHNAGWSGDYWSSTPYGISSYSAYYLDFNRNLHYVDGSGRYYGQSVRPVLE